MQTTDTGVIERVWVVEKVSWVLCKEQAMVK